MRRRDLSRPLMIDLISKLKDHVNVSIMKASKLLKLMNRRIQCIVWESHICVICVRTPISKIIFAHAEALLEDMEVFQYLL